MQGLGRLLQGGSQKKKMNYRAKAILEHMRKYTLTSDQLINMSDIEVMVHSRESKRAMEKINQDFPSLEYEFK